MDSVPRFKQGYLVYTHAWWFIQHVHGFPEKGSHWDKVDATKAVLEYGLEFFTQRKQRYWFFACIFFSSSDKTLSLLPIELYHI